MDSAHLFTFFYLWYEFFQRSDAVFHFFVATVEGKERLKDGGGFFVFPRCCGSERGTGGDRSQREKTTLYFLLSVSVWVYIKCSILTID